MSNIVITDCPYYLISRASLLITSALKKGFAKAGVAVTPSYLGVLISLWEEDGLKAVTLSEKACLEPSSMTGMIDRMERDGLVRREDDPNDRRAQRIFLTDGAKQMKESVLTVVDRVLTEVCDGITPEEQEQTKRTLRRVIGNLT